MAVQVLSILLSTEREISQSFSLFFSMLVPSVQQKIIRNLTKSGSFYPFLFLFYSYFILFYSFYFILFILMMDDNNTK